jgi:hypothetical protein
VALRCAACGREATLGEHLEEIDEATWERIAARRSDRA